MLNYVCLIMFVWSISLADYCIENNQTACYLHKCHKNILKLLPPPRLSHMVALLTVIIYIMNRGLTIYQNYDTLMRCCWPNVTCVYITVQIDQYCEKHDLTIMGYYQANELVESSRYIWHHMYHALQMYKWKLLN